ncbi:MAG: tetratricopeptide repeat protein [Bacteroidia bacterium]
MEIYTWKRGKDSLAYAYSVKALKMDSLPENRSIAYNNIGVVLAKLGDYEKALEYKQKALTSYLESADLYYPQVISFYLNLGNSQLEVGQLASARISFREALTYLNLMEEHFHSVRARNWIDSHRVALNNEMASLFFKKNQPDSAYKLLKEAEALGYDPAHTLHNLGMFFSQKGDSDKSIAYLNQVLKMAPKNHLSAILLGKVYLGQKKTEAALAQFQQALIILTTNFHSRDYRQNPEWEDISQRSSFFWAILNKVNALRTLEKNTFNLKFTFETIQLAVTLSDSLNQDYQSEGTRKIFQERTRELYEMAISTAFDLYEATGNREVLYQAFEWTEKSKSALLTAHIHKMRLCFMQALIRQRCKKKLFEVNRWRTFYANQINLAKQEESSIDSERLTYWKNQKFDFNQKYDSLKGTPTTLSSILSAYDYGVISIAEIQKMS